MLTIIMAIALFVIVYLPYSLRDDSDNVTATCTVTKAYTKDRGGSDVSGMTDIAPVGIFETKECGTLRLSVAPSGWKVPDYVQTAQVGKSTYFMWRMTLLKRNGILIQPALKKSKNNHSIN